MKKKSEFKSDKEFFKYLVANKAELILLKKGAIKISDSFTVSDVTSKALTTNYQDDISSGQIKRTIIANTYNWMDSHDDVHLDGLFAKSIAEKGNSIFHLHDHIFETTAKVGKPISFYEKSVSWSDLGISKAGNTQALFLDSNIIKDWNPVIFQQYLLKSLRDCSV